MIDVAVGVLSWRAHETLRHSLARHKQSGIDKVATFFVHFNEMDSADVTIAQAYDAPYTGTTDNRGILGGFKAIAQNASSEFILILENDICPIDGADVSGCISSCVEDMRVHKINIFCLRSREQPGAGGLWRKYSRCFPIYEPLTQSVPAGKPSLTDILEMRLRHGTLARFRAAAIYAERQPERVQPKAVRKLPSGNYVTDSRYRNWSNQSVLIRRDFFLEVICKRVEMHPDRRTVNGFQDIEKDLNCWWWRRRREQIGHAENGVFTHARFDR